MMKKIAEIYWEEEMGKTIIKWYEKVMANLKGFPTCFLDLKKDIIYGTENRFGDSSEFIKKYKK